MKTILSHQNIVPNAHDILVIDGHVSEYVGTEEQKKAMDILNSSNGMQQVHIPIWLKWFGGNSTLQIFCSNDALRVNSHLETKDNLGRHLPFAFYCDNNHNFNYISQSLEDYGILANVRVNKKDLFTIRKTLEWRKKKWIIILLVLAIILLFVILK